MAVLLEGTPMVTNSGMFRSVFTAPTVNLTPFPMAGLVPVPYPNFATHSAAVLFAPTVSVEGFGAFMAAKTKIPTSTGDGGVAGVSSGTVMLTAQVVTGSFTVFVCNSPGVSQFKNLATMNAGNTVGVAM